METNQPKEGRDTVNPECAWFEEALNRTDDLSEQDAARFERHIRECEFHGTMLAEDEAIVGPRLERFGKAIREAFERGMRESGDAFEEKKQS